MSTVLLSDDRQHTTIHPPDTEGRQILSIPDHDELRRLGLADRLGFRFGLWLLQRSIRIRESAAPRTPEFDRRPLRESEAMALLAWGLQRHML
ncbi:hypothetical protein [Microbacterium sp. USHLN186]|uniref:hypothetical protein n=1 Tax=Microbacterium sp. USHLN186 TaxID=3081286 RepID=UPI003018F613